MWDLQMSIDVHWLPNLQPYLEAQCESLVYAIQSVLGSVRATNPQPLDEHLTQIITIVSSIVAVCNESIPFAGREILKELSQHCDRLSEVQVSMGGGNGNNIPNKETRQIVAKSSFAVANAVKSLMKLWSGITHQCSHVARAFVFTFFLDDRV